MQDTCSERHKRVLGNGSPDKTLMPMQSWKGQVRNRIKSVDELGQFLGVELGDDVRKAAGTFPMAITPYYASLIRTPDQSDPVFRMAVPSVGELIQSPSLSDDPLNEEGDSPVHGLVHRYNDRALVISTSICAMYCRHCTRKRVTGQKEHCTGDGEINSWVEYLTGHPEIKDVIISGGDPLTMATAELDKLLTSIRSVSSVEVIRIGTRVPVVMPMRVDQELVQMIRKHHPVWVNTHFNHPNEITPESKKACEMLADAGIPLGNQSVLLKGVNDDPVVMENLCRALVRMRNRPYYMFQCDLVRGVEHFRTPVSVGVSIMEHLRGRLSGLAIPTFVIDAPAGGGKIPVLPNYVQYQDEHRTILRNYEGKVFEYPEPN